MAAVDKVLPSSLLDLLSNDLILRHTSPYIGIKSLVSLATTSKAYKSLVYDTPQVFQHVDLHRIGVLMWAAWDVSIDPEKFDDIYAQRYRTSTIFTMLENRNVIQDVRTLILDGLYVPTTVIEDILYNERYQIRLLSVRNIGTTTTHIMMRILHHLVRPSRPTGTPKLKGLYMFGQRNRPQSSYNSHEITERPEAIGITASMGAQLGAGNHMDYDQNGFRKTFGEDPYSDSPYGAPGLSNVPVGTWSTSEWPEILEACTGLIAFDGVLCRHDREKLADSRPKLATVRLTGCKSCGTCPEGPAYPGTSPPHHLPLLSPPPLHSPKVEVAQRIVINGQSYPPLILRCRTCLKDRWCERCNTWWCESCYTIPKNRVPNKRDPASIIPSPVSTEDIKVHNGLCVSKCLMDELLIGVGEGGMWG